MNLSVVRILSGWGLRHLERVNVESAVGDEAGLDCVKASQYLLPSGLEGDIGEEPGRT